MRTFRGLMSAVLVLAFIASGTAQVKGGKPQNYKKLQYPKLREIQVPEPTRFELPNGMIVYLLEDHTLPVVNASVMVRTGSRYEPPDKVGLASMTGQVMRTGGTTTKTGEEIDSLLGRVGASVETFIGVANGGARMTVLKEDVEFGLGILSDVLRNPVFREDKIELAKVQARSAISRRNDEISGISYREFSRLIYGPTPYGRLQEYAHVENIERQDLVDFHKKFFFPNATMMAIWGDIDIPTMKKKVEDIFSTWQKGDVKLPVVPTPRMAKQQTVNFIKKDDVNQAYIAMGHLGGLLNDPESAGLNLADQAFGGAFASRLFKKVRSDQGLAYAVYSSWGESWDYPGVFRMGGSTKSGSMMKMVRSIINEFNDVIKNGITDEELKFAKDSYLNSFVFQYDTKGKVISQLLTLEFFGYQKDYIQKQQREVQAATKQSVNDAIKKRWNADALTILVVGKDADFDEPLSALGQVKTIDITIPAPPEKIPDPTAETITRGRDVARRAFAAMGGNNALKLKDLSLTGSMKATGPMGEVEMKVDMSVLYPDKAMRKMSTPMGDMTMAIDGKTGWMKFPMGVRDLPASQADEMYKNLVLDPYVVLRNVDSPDYTIYFYKEENVNDRPATGVIVKHGPTGASSRWFFDNGSMMLVKSVTRGQGPSGPQDQEEFYEDYRDVSGVKFAFKVQQMAEGKKQMEMQLSSVQVNTGLKGDAFKKPAQ